MTRAADLLRAGCDILDAVLVPHGFQFVLRDAGQSSGGDFAWGEYVRGDRRLALHFRASLGLVAYYAGDMNVSHEWFVRAVRGAPGAYPGFSDDALDGFRHLRHDLEACGGPFLRGTDQELHSVLQRAVEQERHKPKGFKALFES
jgi:hypothetical protein